ncbi:hypothetical protein P280DRAFT_543952 [Massarina eburnea CBS 473.64]|uniref:Jacalin-type lectin domain-containing protein n=1 Tax=Massarina eburnea CBS 473.64 TaxID=1395130 RepID=A0A6A6RFM5_9PLEO|nr:hypothetical protein P280DRAFT_543952 [Massarina eburnea CBS 473.64]
MKLLATLLATSAALIASVAAIGDCDNGPFAGLQAVGDKHDASDSDIPICETQWKRGRVVKGVEVWGSKDRISGIQLTYTNDDKSNMIGARAGVYHQSLDWDPATVTVSRAVLWSDKDARQLGGLRIELSNDQNLEMKVDKISSVVFSPDVGSGILMGGWGRADDHITAWGWMFLEDKVSKISIGDFKWDQDQKQFAKSQAGIKSTVLTYDAHYTTTSNATTVGFDVPKSVTNSYSYSQSVSFTFGFGYQLEISAQVAGAGPKSTTSINFEVGTESTKTWSKSDNVGLTFKVSQPAVPGKTTMCVGFVEFGEFDMGYDAKVTILLKNGKKFEFRERGQRKQAFYGGARTACAEQQGDHSQEDAWTFVEKNNKQATKKQTRFISQSFEA